MTHHPPEDRRDDALARLAASTRAESFGPHFADRVMDRVRAERSTPGFSRSRVTGLRLLGSPGRLAAAVAAAVLLVAVAGSWWMRHTRVIEAGASPVVASLPDGTTVTVAPGSSVRHTAFVLRARRAVTLEGEAFFEVVAGSSPFVVETHDALVTVTGTRFNVRSWTTAVDRSTEVALVEGSVLLAARSDDDAPLTLAPGQTGRVEPSGPVLVPSAPDAGAASAWRTGGIAYSDRPLADVLQDLERRFGVRIDADAAVVDGRSVTYLNPGEAHLDDVLDALAFALNVRLVRTAQGWRIVEPNPELP